MCWDFLDAECPDTANPDLWRQAQLTSRHGLDEVADGIYQVRGFDTSNTTLVEGDAGVIVIDGLISQEVAPAAIALYREHRGDRAVTGMIDTHAHIDHFGGVPGVGDANTKLPTYAPEHFREHAVSETACAETAMLRRGYYDAALAVPKSPTVGTRCPRNPATIRPRRLTRRRACGLRDPRRTAAEQDHRAKVTRPPTDYDGGSSPPFGGEDPAGRLARTSSASAAIWSRISCNWAE
jgi:hypothetical protein